MLKRMARICCVGIAGLMAACGGSPTSVDASETGESSADFNAAGAPDVDGDAAQADARTRLADNASGHGSVFEARLGGRVQPAEAPELPRACPPWCAVNTAPVPLDTSTARPRATTP
jgi:hypothetical protein